MKYKKKQVCKFPVGTLMFIFWKKSCVTYSVQTDDFLFLMSIYRPYDKVYKLAYYNLNFNFYTNKFFQPLFFKMAFSDIYSMIFFGRQRLYI